MAPVWAPGHCRISPPRFLAECCKRQLNQGSFVLLYFRLSTFSDLYWVCLAVFFCTVLFISISHVIGCEYRLRNDLYCVEWGVKLYSNQLSKITRIAALFLCLRTLTKCIQCCYFSPVEQWSIVMTVSACVCACMSVCLSVCVFVCPWGYLSNCTSNLYQIFYACYPWSWLGPLLAALRYVMYFQFYGWHQIYT